MNTHYDTLGIDPSAEAQDVKKAYFELAKKYHPDSGDEREVKKFYEISEAYKILSDAELKKAYDETLNSGLERIKAVEAEIISKNPIFPTIHVKKRDSFRDIELKEFHKNRLKNAVLRVIGFTLIFSALGAFIAIILSGRWYLGGIAGLMIGFSISIKENFDLSTFFDSERKRHWFQFFRWLLLILGIAYFVGIAITLTALLYE